MNQKRKSLTEQFKFPERLHHSQNSYSRANSNIDVKQRARAYRLYVEGWYSEVAKWLKKNNISLDITDFKRLYNRSLKQKVEKKTAKGLKSIEKSKRESNDYKNKDEHLEIIEKSKEELGITEETKEVASAPRK